MTKRAYLASLIEGQPVKSRPSQEIKDLRTEIHHIGNNINQIARTVNARGFASGEDIAAITAAQKTIWNIAERL